MAALAKTEPTLEPVMGTAQDVQQPSSHPATAVMAPAPGSSVPALAAADAQLAGQGSGTDQVSRIEDKTARIEEKFARSEERMMRLESALEKATLRLEGASQDMNLQGVRDDIARLRDQVGRKPGAATIFVIALVAALIGAGVAFALARYGIPGLPR